MSSFIIIELEDGMSVVELRPGERPDEAAVRNGGILIDPSAYPSYDEAYDAMSVLQEDEEDDLQ